MFGALGPVAWVMALTCLVPVHLLCSFGGSSHKSFTHTARFLQVVIIRCFSEVMTVQLLADGIIRDNAAFHLWAGV